MFDYESPITQIVSDMQMGYENGVLKAVQSVGFNVNKKELTKALLYDREQYQKGYEDGLKADKWIPCSERLPKEGKYLICDNVGNVYESTFFNNRWLIFSVSDEVIAWMELPAPYQKGE